MKSVTISVLLVAAGPALVAKDRPIDFALVISSSASSLHDPHHEEAKTYVLVDGGMIEHGRRIGGDPAPRAETLAVALTRALAEQGWRANQSGSTPDVLLIYHTGALRNEEVNSPEVTRGQPTSRQIPIRSDLAPRLAMLGLRPGTFELARAIAEQNFVGLSGHARSLFRDVQKERYFLVLAAYDYSAASDGKLQQRWRGMASCEANASSMKVALQSAAVAVAQQFGAPAGTGSSAMAANAKPMTYANEAASTSLVRVAPTGLELRAEVLQSIREAEVRKTLQPLGPAVQTGRSRQPRRLVFD